MSFGADEDPATQESVREVRDAILDSAVPRRERIAVAILAGTFPNVGGRAREYWPHMISEVLTVTDMLMAALDRKDS